ncbi:glycosyltransferase family 2 protein [Streptomyces sp. NPDC059740]|uniref:glycosyltransferase family 2 protein n=1 Tax=Streptomyces sp. NPDC059740 TaxID=3346926 RepID=UPI003658AAD2
MSRRHTGPTRPALNRSERPEDTAVLDAATHTPGPAPHATGHAEPPAGDDTRYAVVIPTIGRSCLADCLATLAAATGPAPQEVVVVDDRPAPTGDLPLEAAGELCGRVRVVTSGGRGPAAARNAGLRTTTAPWVVFLDDDVQVMPDWRERLTEDLAAADPRTGGVQGRLRVPLPGHRRATDWERGTAGLQHAAWATADMAYRARALRDTGGFDERFRRAFREDADLALRMGYAGWHLTRGTRLTRHPVRPVDRWVSVRAQRGNADDALMTHLHGPDWWLRARAPRGRLPRHAAVTTAALVAPVLALAGRPRAAAWAAGLWALGTAEFAAARIAPGPRTAEEITTMLLTSLVIPPLAVHHRLTGLVRHRAALLWGGGAA